LDGNENYFEGKTPPNIRTHIDIDREVLAKKVLNKSCTGESHPK